VLDEEEAFLTPGDDVRVDALLVRPRVAIRHGAEVFDEHAWIVGLAPSPRTPRGLLPVLREKVRMKVISRTRDCRRSE
jgi:hypothetical protein